MPPYNPRSEAREFVGAGYDARVLEPSPPTVSVDPFADDPTARGATDEGRRIVSPVTDGDVTFDALCRERVDLAPFCAARWLGAWPRLMPLPSGDLFLETLDSLHALAEHVVCGARHRVNGKIGLRYVRGGFGTPFFGDDEQVRVVGDEIVRTLGDGEQRTPITTLGDAAAFVGTTVGVPGGLFTPTTNGDPTRRLLVDERAATALADWYGFATSVLAQLRVDFAGQQPSLVQIWPEHFDASTEAGDEAAGSRATFGASPGDAEHPQPYLYVSAWAPDRIDRADPYWNETFGASLPYGALLDAPDQRETAFAFYRAGAGKLSA
jgi:hypothetical protein